MKLFAQYNRLNILSTIVTFIVGSCFFYFLLHYILVKQIDTGLQSEKEEVFQYVKVHHVLPDAIDTRDQRDVFVKGAHTNEILETVKYKDNDDKEEQFYRNIRFNIVVNGANYAITISKPLEGTELLLKLIILVTVIMIALILIAGLVINRRILSKVWQPFYDTVEQIKKYNLSTTESVTLKPTDIEEFALLNQSISAMMERALKDYDALKKFTGHAAHEMQTPLAIIRSKMDVLMQQEAFLHHYGPGIMEIEHAVQRLSRLNHSLLLLTKVENRQFLLNEDVRIDEIISHKCSELAEMMHVKHISVSVAVMPCIVRFHTHLAEILVSNLINNAIRYNSDNGVIIIKLEQGVLTIANTSKMDALEYGRVFQRFYRHRDVKAEGNGLGLSIVKQICDVAGFNASYSYVNEQHVFSIDFNS